ncbi:MAG: GUN4 domain-containing protein [Pleurocapsa sp. MO_192.B19]|nr:GUN4 domain-containing protein [Pleurocapsa sp. MO_192.B19]
MTNSKYRQDIDLQLDQQLSKIKVQLEELDRRVLELEKNASKTATVTPSSEKESSEIATKISELKENFFLVSDIYRYRNLQNYLVEEKWSEADTETIDLILKITEKEIEDLSPEDIKQIPCKDLMTIDQLWRKHSKNRFGFSIQLGVYQELGGNLDTTVEQNRELIAKWGDRLGWHEKGRWLKCSELDYSLNAPTGCLPSRWWNSPYGSKMTNFFLGRLISCNL